MAHMAKRASVVLVAALCGAIYAGSITGTVTSDDSGEPIVSANVALLDSSLVSRVVAVDKKGAYTFECTGNYRLIAAASGFRPDTVVGMIGSKEAQVVDFSLVPDSIIRYGAIEGVVTDSATGDRITNASIDLYLWDESTSRWATYNSTVSSRIGLYSFDGVLANTVTYPFEYKIHTNKAGYIERIVSPVIVLPDEATEVNLALAQSPASIPQAFRPAGTFHSEGLRAARTEQSVVRVISPGPGTVRLYGLNGSLVTTGTVETGTCLIRLPQLTARRSTLIVTYSAGSQNHARETVLLR